MANSRPEGFLAVPESGGGPGVLVLHAWWGLNETIKELCGRLAAEGFVAFAPDLYHGKLAVTIEEAEALSGTLDDEQARADLAGAVEYLSQQTGASERALGAIGFSLGAYYALRLSFDYPERVRAVVLFYGAGEGEYERSRADYLGHFAENDPYESPDWINEMENALRAAGRPVTFHQYAGTGHWFFEPDRPDAYNAEAAQLAWERTVAFLKERL